MTEPERPDEPPGGRDAALEQHGRLDLHCADAIAIDLRRLCGIFWFVGILADPLLPGPQRRHRWVLQFPSWNH